MRIKDLKPGDLVLRTFGLEIEAVRVVTVTNTYIYLSDFTVLSAKCEAMFAKVLINSKLSYTYDVNFQAVLAYHWTALKDDLNIDMIAPELLLERYNKLTEIEKLIYDGKDNKRLERL